MVKKGFLKKCILVKGCGLVGWVIGNLFQEYWQHSSAETGRLRGLMDWEGFFICRTPDSFCDHGQVITWNFSLQVSCEDKSSFMPFRVVM